MSHYYFVVIEESVKYQHTMDYSKYKHSGLIAIHPLSYLEALIKRGNEANGTTSFFVLLNWFVVTEEEWHRYEDHRLVIYKVEDTIASKNMEFPAEPNIHSDQMASSDIYVEDRE